MIPPERQPLKQNFVGPEDPPTPDYPDVFPPRGPLAAAPRGRGQVRTALLVPGVPASCRGDAQ